MKTNLRNCLIYGVLGLSFICATSGISAEQSDSSKPSSATTSSTPSSTDSSNNAANNSLQLPQNQLAIPDTLSFKARPLNIVIPSPPELNAKAYLLVDANSGQELVAKNINERLEPASLTKMMTAYVVDRALAEGKIHLNQLVPISEKAWRMEGSRMFVQVDTKVTVQDLIKGVIIQSGNDASVALAEFIAGSEESFADLMNQEAARLGMTDTHFANASGVPDDNHYTTARDLAILARAIITDFPKSYAYYSEKWFVYNNIRQPNRNLLLWRDSSVDGIKTGHTDNAGYCLVSSAKRDKMRLISVVMGAPSSIARADQSAQLFTFGFRFYETHHLFAANKPVVEPRIWMASNETLPLGFAEDFWITIPKASYKELKAEVQLPLDVKPPVQKGQPYGELVFALNDKILTALPLTALEAVEKGNIFQRFRDYVELTIKKWLHKKDQQAAQSNIVPVELPALPSTSGNYDHL